MGVSDQSEQDLTSPSLRARLDIATREGEGLRPYKRSCWVDARHAWRRRNHDAPSPAFGHHSRARLPDKQCAARPVVNGGQKATLDGGQRIDHIGHADEIVDVAAVSFGRKRGRRAADFFPRRRVRVDHVDSDVNTIKNSSFTQPKLSANSTSTINLHSLMFAVDFPPARRDSFVTAINGERINDETGLVTAEQRQPAARVAQRDVRSQREAVRIQFIGNRVWRADEFADRRIVPALGDQSLWAVHADHRAGHARPRAVRYFLAHRDAALFQSGRRT
jgi:hypothetical protein